MRAIVILLLVFLAVAGGQGATTTPLPPPEDDEGTAPEGADGGVVGEDGQPQSPAPEEEEELRGLKGMANPLNSLQKSMQKCGIKGNYGIKGECSKYIDCRKKGAVTAFKYCPSGKFFDHIKRKCTKSSDAECKHPCSDGESLYDEKSKTSLTCVKGVPMPN